jgi:hypothetical protein
LARQPNLGVIVKLLAGDDMHLIVGGGETLASRSISPSCRRCWSLSEFANYAQVFIFGAGSAASGGEASLDKDGKTRFRGENVLSLSSQKNLGCKRATLLCVADNQATPVTNKDCSTATSRLLSAVTVARKGR